MGATATSLLSAAAGALPLAGVHLFAFFVCFVLPTSIKACCWAPLPMAPLPMVAFYMIFQGRSPKVGQPSERGKAIGVCTDASAAWSP